MSITIAQYESTASRLEFCCIRVIYGGIVIGIIGGISAMIMSLIIGIYSFFNFWSILLMGKRLEGAYDWWVKLNSWSVNVGLYMAGLTDERPPLTPF